MSSKMLRAGGAGLSDEQREEMTNREGVAAGGATRFFANNKKGNNILNHYKTCQLKNFLCC